MQFDHRMLAYAIFVIAMLHAIDVAGAVEDRGVRTGAFVLFAAILLQVALGIATLLWVVPLSLALLHQAMAMLVLTAATVHAALLKHQPGNLPRIAARAGIHPGSPLTRRRAGWQRHPPAPVQVGDHVGFVLDPIDSRTTSGPAPAVIFCASSLPVGRRRRRMIKERVSPILARCENNCTLDTSLTPAS